MLSYKYYLNTVTRTVSKHTATVMLRYHIYYLNTVTLTVSKHRATLLSNHINITSTQSQLQSVNTQLYYCHVIVYILS